MEPLQRQQQILAPLHAMRTELTAEELAHNFAVPTLTIRRDLRCLEAANVILQTHGSCVFKASVEPTSPRESTPKLQFDEAMDKAAANEVKANDIIPIGDGSMPFQLNLYLGRVGELCAYTSRASIPAYSLPRRSNAVSQSIPSPNLNLHR